MREELEKQLQLEFPFMMQKDLEEERNPYNHWGIECGDGWYDLLHDLCTDITKRYELEEMPVDIVVLQVKEKFASLRFYYEYKDSPRPLQAIDFIGSGTGLRMTPDNSDDEQKKKLRKDIAEFVRSYEKKSASVCEKCGAEGEKRNLTPYYISTLCESCYNKYLLDKEEKEKNR